MPFIISNKYEIIEQIGEGSFGKVFVGKHLRTNKKIAIKIQFKSIVNVLQHEAKIYKQLFDISGVPIIRNFGCEEGFHYLILDLYDNCLDKLELNKKEIIYYLIEAIKILNRIHEKGIIHRDIKPDNFMVKLDEKANNKENKLFLIDFGLSKRYINEKNEHIPENKGKKLIGTAKYVSLNVHNGIEASRRDDLESLCYCFISLYEKKLKWDNLCKNLKSSSCKETIYKEIKFLKEERNFDICSEFNTMLIYVKKLKFDEIPNYNYLIGIFTNLLLIS